MRLKTTKKPKKVPIKCGMCEAEFLLQGFVWKEVDCWGNHQQIRCPYCNRWIKINEVTDGDK